MLNLSRFFISVFLVLFLSGCIDNTPVTVDPRDTSEDLLFSDEAADPAFDSIDKRRQSRADMLTFQPAGDFGGGVLVPGTFYPPSGNSFSKLYRGNDRVRYKIRTNGLPPGAYTVWMVVINNPENCVGDCDEADVFENPATNSSAFWTDGGIVESDGIGKFRGEAKVGEISSDPRQHIFGPGLVNPEGAEVHLIVKYHGPVSSDPDEFWLQTHTLQGLCESGANAYDLSGAGLGIQCFDPQLSIHKAQ
jgi:hypothetical protein